MAAASATTGPEAYAPTPTTQRGGTSSRVRGAVQAAAGGGLGNLAGKVSVLYDEPSNSLIIITARRYYESVRKLAHAKIKMLTMESSITRYPVDRGASKAK